MIDTARAPDGSLRLADLLSDFPTLVNLTSAEVQREHWLDAYLLAAGADQVIVDTLHPDPLSANRLAAHLERRGGSAANGARIVRGAAQQLLNTAVIPDRRWQAWQRAWATQVVAPLARQVARQIVSGDLGEALSAGTVRSLVDEVRLAPPRLRHALLRLPSCFHSFDQQPEDIHRLVRKFLAESPDRSSPLAILGIRSSGSYLSPLCRAFLEFDGFRDVIDLTIRPGRNLHPVERAMLQRTAARGGCALVLDDPPRSGGSLRQAGLLLEQLGFPARKICMLAAIFDAGGQLPEALAPYRRVILPWTEWSVHEQLSVHRVQTTLAALVTDQGALVAVTPHDSVRRTWSRGHIRARFSMQIRRSERAVETLDVCAEGVGLGYFGTHALAVYDRLSDFLPRVYGVQHGLLFREWLDPKAQLRPDTVAGAADSITAYVLARAERLPLQSDKSANLRGRDAVWELAANILEAGFGRRASKLARPLVRKATLELLRARHPAVVDGATDADNWFQRESPARLAKVSFAERDFSNLDGFTCDPVYDLAGASTLVDDSNVSAALRNQYQRRSGEHIEPERWLLYRIVQAQLRLRTSPSDFVRIADDNARALRDYVSETILADVIPPATGPVCAIDLDGVLECEQLGFTGLTPGAAIALRALVRHGYRPVIISGRAFGEIQDRCRAYRLAGCAAEYGAVVYTHLHLQPLVYELLSADEVAALERVRAILQSEAGVTVEGTYTRGVRAYRIRRAFSRQGLDPACTASVLEKSGVEGWVRSIEGQSQTDFMVHRIDKGLGLAKLLDKLSEPAPVAMAVGDSASDLPMLRLARLALAPANADAAVRRAGIRLTRGSFQLGFIEAVGLLLGHTPGGCSRCRAPRLNSSTRLMLAVMGAADHPGARKLAALAKLAWSAYARFP